MEGSEEEMGGGLEESAWPLLGPPLKFVTLMMVMRLIIKSITSVTSIAKPVVIPGMVPIVVVVVASPILVVIFASESVVVVIIIVVAVPLVAVVVVADSPVADSIHHLVVLIALEWILLLLLLHSVSLLIATIREVCLHLLRPTSIHFGVPIIFQLPLSVFPALICQLPVHVRLLAVPAANWSPVATVGKLIQLTDDVVIVTIVAVMVTIAITIVVVTVVAIVLAVVRLVTGRQWTAACTVSVHVAVVGRGGITGSGR